jgi:hypothetical protein
MLSRKSSPARKAPPCISCAAGFCAGGLVMALLALAFWTRAGLSPGAAQQVSSALYPRRQTRCDRVDRL